MSTCLIALSMAHIMFIFGVLYRIKETYLWVEHISFSPKLVLSKCESISNLKITSFLMTYVQNMIRLTQDSYLEDRIALKLSVLKQKV